MRLAELTVVRHGQSAANAALAAAEAAGRLDSGVAGRDADVELTPLGLTQAAALGHRLADQPSGERPQAVVCSPYRRAVQSWRSAQAAAARRGVPLPDATVDARLSDRRMGELELTGVYRVPSRGSRANHR